MLYALPVVVAKANRPPILVTILTTIIFMNTGVATTPTAERGLSISNEMFWIV